MVDDDKKSAETQTETAAPETQTAEISQTDAPETVSNDPGMNAESALADNGLAVTKLEAEKVIEAFGGIRPMANKLNITFSTVQGWKARGRIPDNRWRDIIAAASANEIDLGTITSPAKTPDDVAEENGVEENGAEASDRDSPWAETSQDSHKPAQIEGTVEQPETEDAEYRSELNPTHAQTPIASDDLDVPKAAKPSGGGGLALFVGVLALAAVVARPLWAPHIDPKIAALAPNLIQNPGDAEPSIDLSAVETRLAALEARPITTAEDGTVALDLSGLEDRLAALEAAPSTETGDLLRLEARLATLEQNAGPVDSAPELLQRIADMEASLAALTDAAEGLSTARDEAAALVGETRTALDVAIDRSQDIQTRAIERLSVVESQIAQLAMEIETAVAKAAALRAEIDSQGQDLEALLNRPALQASAQASIALAASDLESALAAGRSPTIALERLISLAGNDAELVRAANALKALTATPLATRAGLTTAFRSQAPQIQAELGAVDGDAWDSMWTAAQSLITIRRKGEAPEDPPVSRAEAALDRGDLNSALAALSEAAAQSASAAGWVAEAERLLRAQEALATLRAAVADRLGPANDGEAS